MRCRKCEQERLPKKVYCRNHACSIGLCPNPAKQGSNLCTAHVALPPSKASQPKKEVVAPKQVAVAPKQEAVAPKQEAVAPKQEAVAPKQEAVAPQQEAVAPKQVAVAPKQVVIPPLSNVVAKKVVVEDAPDPRIQAIIDAWALVTNEPAEAHDNLFADVRYTRFFIHAENAIETDVAPQRRVSVSGGHYFLIIRDPRGGQFQNTGYLVDTHAVPPVVRLDDLSAFLSNLAQGRIGDGAYILALRPKDALAPIPRRALQENAHLAYTSHDIAGQQYEFLNFRHNNCGAVATLGVGCLPPPDTYNLVGSPYHEIHRFLGPLSARYIIHAAYRAPAPLPAMDVSHGSDAQQKEQWAQFNKQLKGRGDTITYEDYLLSVLLSRDLASGAKKKEASTSAAPSRVFVHRWGCVQLVVRMDGTPAPRTDALAGACAHVNQAAFPVAYGASLAPTPNLARLAELGFRLVAIPQSLFELILLTAPLVVDKKSARATFGTFADEPALVCRPEQVVLRTFKNRHTPYELKNPGFMTYANQWVVHYLFALVKGPLPVDWVIADWLAIAARVFTLVAESGKSAYQGKHLANAVSEEHHTKILRSLRLEFDECGKEGPGFQLYRVTTEHSEDSSLTTHEISYGASLFGGWIFDGPDNGSKSACVMAYLMSGGSSKNSNYYVLRIRKTDWDTQQTFANFQRRLRTLTLPPLPVCLQMFGFEGGFHPRMSKTSVAGVVALSDQEALQFMRRYHRAYRQIAETGTDAKVQMFPDL